MKKSAVFACASALVSLAAIAPSAASAATVFTENFDGDSRVAPGNFGIFSTVGIFTSTTKGIEIQNGYPGLTPPDTAPNLIELDTTANSSMFTNITAGNYKLTFAYSPRPGVGDGSNGILVTLGDPVAGTVLYSISGSGVGQTSTNFLTQTVFFNTTTGGALTFSATGDSDGLGGFVDSITLVSAVPEPATWGMMMLGFGMIGFGLRASRNRKATTRIAYA